MTQIKIERLSQGLDIWLSPSEAAYLSGHHYQTIVKACRSGKLASVRRGRLGHVRILRSSVEKWMGEVASKNGWAFAVKPGKPRTSEPSFNCCDDPALNTEQACHYLGGLHAKTLLKFARLGEVASIQLAPGGPLKFRRSALNAFLARHERPASPD